MLSLIANAIIVLSLKVTPQVCAEPCTIKASITIEGLDPEREVCLGIIYEGEDEAYTRSCWPWTGRKQTDVTISRIPAGSYTVEVRAGGRRAATSLTVVEGAIAPEERSW